MGLLTATVYLNTNQWHLFIMFCNCHGSTSHLACIVVVNVRPLCLAYRSILSPSYRWLDIFCMEAALRQHKLSVSSMRHQPLHISIPCWFPFHSEVLNDWYFKNILLRRLLVQVQKSPINEAKRITWRCDVVKTNIVPPEEHQLFRASSVRLTYGRNFSVSSFWMDTVPDHLRLSTV